MSFSDRQSHGSVSLRFKFQDEYSFYRITQCSPLTTLCLDISFITSRPLNFIRYYLMNCCRIHCLYSRKSLSMQVFCSCCSFEKKGVFLFFFVRNQMFPAKPWSKISVSALHHQWICDNLFVA